MQGKQVIPLRQVLAHMASTCVPFSLRYVKYNEQKGTGGEVVELSGQLLSGKGRPRAAPPVTPAPESVEAVLAWARRNPHHYANGTRNLKSTVNGRYTKVHIFLITEFEGKKVII